MSEALFYYASPSKVKELYELSFDQLGCVLGNAFAKAKAFPQNNPHHCYDLLNHTIKTVEFLNCDNLNETESYELRIAALYHDIGKPAVAFEKDGRTVFYNHAAKSRELAQSELVKYELGECSLDRILFYIEHHDDFISFKLKSKIKNSANPFIVPITLTNVYKKILSVQNECQNNNGYVPTLTDFFNLMRLCAADAMAQSREVYQNGILIDSMKEKLLRINKISHHIQTIITADMYSCDLHTHSIFSDGTDTPLELVEKASANSLAVLALTDHNTVDGLENFQDVSKEFDVDTVSGVEFSTEYKERELHILALFVRKDQHEKIREFLYPYRNAKEESNKKLIFNLHKAGFDASYEELADYSSSGNINRAVIAQYLYSKGIISSIKEGFDTILSKKTGYYIPPNRPQTLETIKFIKSMGATAVLAHPLLDLSFDELVDFIPVAKNFGLDAIEAYYSLFTKEQECQLIKIAEDNGLLISGGSDYHGAGKPHIMLGVGTGSLNVPLSAYLKFIEILKL